MKTWGCGAFAWAVVSLALGWRQSVGGGWLALVALAFAPMFVWTLAWMTQREVRGHRAIDVEALAWEQSGVAPPR